MLPIFLEENRYKYQNNSTNQLQLFGNLTAGCSVKPLNYLGNEQNASVLRPNKRSREAEDILRQKKLQTSLNYMKIYKDEVHEADASAGVIRLNPVSTGLKLSYDDDEHNSSVTSGTANGSMPPTASIILSLGDSIRTELDQQKEELNQYIKIQQEHLMKEVRDMKQRHMTAFLSTLETGVGKKLREKDSEIENINRRNKELVERIKQVGMEAQNWQYRAKYNESVVHILKNNLQQAMSQGADQGKEGFGDSEVDDTASHIDPKNYLCIREGPTDLMARNDQGLNEHIVCKACRSKDVSILLMPCRHLCLCKACEGFVNACPVCQSIKTASIQVYLS